MRLSLLLMCVFAIYPVSTSHKNSHFDETDEKESVPETEESEATAYMYDESQERVLENFSQSHNHTAEMLSVNKGYYLCSVFGYIMVIGKFGKEDHLLCLKIRSIATSSLLTSLQTTLILDPDKEDEPEEGAKRLADITMAYGFPIENPAEGTAEGYVGYDGHFYGVLHFSNRTLHADPHKIDEPGKYFGGCQEDSIVFSRKRRDKSQVNRRYLELLEIYGPRKLSIMEELKKLHISNKVVIKPTDAEPKYVFPFKLEPVKRVPGIARSRVCSLLLLADKSFFELDARSNLNLAVQRMVHAVAQADIIFRNADFDEDGVPDNIGFSIKYILVMTSDSTNRRLFGDLLDNQEVEGRSYLMRFARLRRLSDVCLGVAFSGHSFNNRTLGLSFTSLGGGMGGAAGGLCDRRAYGRSFNTLVIAHAMHAGARVPERIAALTLAHELGHSFGAHHDENFPNPECRGYLMGAQSSAGDSLTHFQFSICSRRLVAAALSSMSYCLMEEERPFCGNGIVETNEACDCGFPSQCLQKDPCCTPRGGGALVFEEGTVHREGCLVAPQAKCHPSQGACCTKKCQFANLTQYGIECSKLEKNCSCNEPEQCECGLGGRCLPDGKCHAAECALLGLPECHCGQYGVGGTLSLSRLCGVCCELPLDDVQVIQSQLPGQEQPVKLEGHCVGAEAAAKRVHSRGELPDQWGLYDTNTAIKNLSICDVHRTHCKERSLRAWAPGEPCVAMAAVGECSERGVCHTGTHAAKINLFPLTLKMNSFNNGVTKSLFPNAIKICILIHIKLK